MQYGYIIKISNKNLYKEIQLPVDITRMKVGLSIDCDVRFYKEQFFEDFELVFFKNDEQWQLACSDNIYIDAGDVRKLVTKKLNHGDSFSLKYQNSESELFRIDFLFDFDNENKDYSRMIDIASARIVSIGNAANCNIVLSGEYVKNDYIELQNNGKQLILHIKSYTYGIYHNGKLAKTSEVINECDFFSIADFSFYYKNGRLRTGKNVRINGLNYVDEAPKGSYPKFIKNVRIHGKINEEDIEILDPAAKPEKPKNNILSSILPSMGMLISAGAMMVISASQNNGKPDASMLIFSGISAAMGIVTAFMGVIDARKDFKKSVEKRISDYNTYIEKKRAEISGYRQEEKAKLEQLFLSSEIEKEEFENFSSNLFDREITDGDFLAVRLGDGFVKAKREIKYKKQEKLESEDELQLIPETIKKEYELIENAPVVCNFKEAGAVSIIGAEENRQSIFRNMVLDICARQFFQDVELIFVAKEENRNKINWLRFLPQVNNPVTGMRNIVCDDESKSRTFDYLYKELSMRAGESDNDKVIRKQIVVFLYDEYGFQNHPISKFVHQAKKLGVTFVFMVENKAMAPTGSTVIVQMNSANQGVMIDTLNGEKPCEFTFHPINEAMARRIVEIMAPVFTEEISLEGSLTKNISLFEMMKILMVSDIDLENRWKNSQVFKSMAAPIGVTKNDYIYLDLHDKAHGPHGLVAGTTGSGKSEILQTYILSIATLFHPYEVSFVIIDFKGGGMVNQFKDLPHLLGAITNIDGKEIDRSLKSIKAELQKRQRLFAEAEVNHIDKYIKKYKAGEVSEPIPHLILIVDEFAELKAEQPDFMKELISAARIGRSLGVHLILATQKPSGQVDDQIWSNSRFKLCLKVQGVEDSNEVLKSPLAAEIKEPGRAYLQVGNNEIFELFQSAYSGAPEKNTDSNVKAFSVNQVSETGKRVQVFAQKKKKTDGNNVTQLEAIVAYVHDYCERKHIDRLPNICLPSLESVIPYPAKPALKAGMVDIGIYDDPDNQVQAPTYLDIANKNTFIVGSSQYGKTNLLQSFIKTIAGVTTPKQSVFYILDFGSMVLKNFENLNHVGGVVTSSEDEKLKNLFKLLFEEMEYRKEKLLEVGVSSFSSYIEAGYKDLPHIYIIVDNMTALSELYLEDDDSLLTIIRDGIAVGISTIMANVQTAGISFKYLSNFANKIALYCNDSNEYTNLFDHAPLQPDEKPGRCILEMDKLMLECQTYLAFEGEKEIERVNGIRNFVNMSNKENEGMRARQIPCIPNVLTQEVLNTDFHAQPVDFSFPIGLTYADVKPFYINFFQLGIMGICGKEGYGHKNFVTYLFQCLKNKDVEIVIFDDISKKFASYKDEVSFYSLNTEPVKDVITQWHEELEGRYNRMMLEEPVASDKQLLVMIVQNNDIAAKIQSDMDINDKFNDIIERYKNMGVCIIFSNYLNSPVSYDAPDALRAIKQNQHIICLEDLQNLKCFDPPYEAIRENKKPISLGSGYYINDNEVTRLKIVMAEEA